MTRKALLAFAAAGAITAIVLLTTGAFAGTSTSSTSTTTSTSSDQSNNGTDAFVSCLASHEVQVPSSDPADLKQWLGDHQSDPAVQAALQACQPDQSGTDLTPAQLAACLEQHEVDVPSDVTQGPGAFKQWLARVIDQPTVKTALDACTGEG